MGGVRAQHAPPPTASKKITVYVATCQFPPVDKRHPENAESWTAPTIFKQVKFPTLVAPTDKVEVLQNFLARQWAVAKVPYADIPITEQFYTFKGRILRLDGTLDGYYIAENDTIYLRFSSLGQICDPWAMSTSELRSELKARNAYVPQLQPEQLMLKLQEQIMKESRLQRLQRATGKEQADQVYEITRELAALSHSVGNARLSSHHAVSKTKPGSNVITAQPNEKFQRPASLQWPHPPCKNLTVFLSITHLERTYQVIPRDVLDPAILIFDTERKWVFDKHNILQKQHFDYKYMCLDADFLEFLTFKEEMGLVFWFRPHTSFEKLSSFLCSIEDPVTQRRFQPLILKEAKWLTLSGFNGWEGKIRQDGRKRDVTSTPKFTASVMRIVTNLRSGSFDYLAVQEILYQANASLFFAPM